jgi:hypothetical protein
LRARYRRHLGLPLAAGPRKGGGLRLVRPAPGLFGK